MNKQDMVDNASAPADIAETNEIESLRSMREEIQNIFRDMTNSMYVLDDEEFAGYAISGKLLDKVVNPDE